VINGSNVTVTATIHQHMRILPVPDRDVRATNTATATPGLIEGDTAGG
jgi:hypothetical protein